MGTASDSANRPSGVRSTSYSRVRGRIPQPSVDPPGRTAFTRVRHGRVRARTSASPFSATSPFPACCGTAPSPIPALFTNTLTGPNWSTARTGLRPRPPLTSVAIPVASPPASVMSAVGSIAGSSSGSSTMTLAPLSTGSFAAARPVQRPASVATPLGRPGRSERWCTDRRLCGRRLVDLLGRCSSVKRLLWSLNGVVMCK